MELSSREGREYKILPAFHHTEFALIYAAHPQRCDPRHEGFRGVPEMRPRPDQLLRNSNRVREVGNRACHLAPEAARHSNRPACKSAPKHDPSRVMWIKDFSCQSASGPHAE